jgi:DNA-directed RNA polymerase specialized sigma24 family protein
MPQLPPLADDRVVRPAETALAAGIISDMDLLRLKSLARLHARGLPPDVGWEDLLQEALTRVLVGTRVQPAGVAMVAFLAGVMRSLRTEHWRRALQGRDSSDVHGVGASNDDAHGTELRDLAADPQRSVMAQDQLRRIQQLFADDALALQIIAGLAEGLSPEQIRAAGGISRTDYDSTRKRMRRALLREGLTCEPK